MTARSAVRRGQRLAAKIMLETCTIQRRSGRTLDPNTDKSVDTFAQVYAGPCRIKPLTAAQQAEAGQVAVELRRYVVSILMSSPIVERGDVVTITVSADSEVVGRPLTVIDVALGELATVRRLIVEDHS